jgi:hypothetical protein
VCPEVTHGKCFEFLIFSLAVNIAAQISFEHASGVAGKFENFAVWVRQGARHTLILP